MNTDTKPQHSPIPAKFQNGRDHGGEVMSDAECDDTCEKCGEPGAEWRQHPWAQDWQEGDIFVCADCFRRLANE